MASYLNFQLSEAQIQQPHHEVLEMFGEQENARKSNKVQLLTSKTALDSQITQSPNPITIT